MYSSAEYKELARICALVMIPEGQISTMVRAEIADAERTHERYQPHMTDREALQRILGWVTKPSTYVGSNTLENTLVDRRELTYFIGSHRRAYVWAKCLGGLYRAQEEAGHATPDAH